VPLSTYEGRKSSYGTGDVHALFVANEIKGKAGVKASESVTESPRREVGRTMSNTTQPVTSSATPTCDGRRHNVRTERHYKEVIVVASFMIGNESQTSVPVSAIAGITGWA
jgi:hypothetical protein